MKFHSISIVAMYTAFMFAFANTQKENHSMHLQFITTRHGHKAFLYCNITGQFKNKQIVFLTYNNQVFNTICRKTLLGRLCVIQLLHSVYQQL